MTEKIELQPDDFKLSEKNIDIAIAFATKMKAELNQFKDNFLKSKEEPQDFAQFASIMAGVVSEMKVLVISIINSVIMDERVADVIFDDAEARMRRLYEENKNEAT